MVIFMGLANISVMPKNIIYLMATGNKKMHRAPSKAFEVCVDLAALQVAVKLPTRGPTAPAHSLALAAGFGHGADADALCVSVPQVLMKEQMREMDELRVSRDEALNEAKENEKKMKTMEADAMQYQEVPMAPHAHTRALIGCLHATTQATAYPITCLDNHVPPMWLYVGELMLSFSCLVLSGPVVCREDEETGPDREG